MSRYVFSSRKHLFANSLLIGVLLASLLAYLYVFFAEPNLRYILLLLLIDFPLLGYFLAVNNSIKIIISNDTLEITWFTGSKDIKLKDIKGYFYYKEPLFEFHLEANFIGAKLKRNKIGDFYYLSPGIRDGLIIEYGNSTTIEKIFIVPKKREEFIDLLRWILLEVHHKNIKEYYNHFFIE